MRYLRYYLLMLMLAALTVTTIGCKQKNKNQEKPASNEEPPLLLEDAPAEDSPAPTGPVADNSRCHVCHINYADEELAVTHAKANIGCEECHGACDAHCSDEDNVTPPDIMYPLDKINSFCMTCHPKDKIDTEPHEAILAGADTEKKYCTDCHGEHRLGHRTRRWDKETGELLEDDQVRMMTDDILKQE